jgi:hypothetical protein
MSGRGQTFAVLGHISIVVGGRVRQRTELPDPELQHLVLSRQHLGFGLVEGTLVSGARWTANKELIALVMAAQCSGRWS